MSELNLFLFSGPLGPTSSWFPSSFSGSFPGNQPTQPCLDWILGLATQVRLKLDPSRHCCWACWNFQSLFSLVWGPKGGNSHSNYPRASSPHSFPQLPGGAPGCVNVAITLPPHPLFWADAQASHTCSEILPKKDNLLLLFPLFWPEYCAEFIVYWSHLWLMSPEFTQTST